MTLPLIIGLAGKKGSGKSTAAQMLVSHFGYNGITAFATPIKRMLVALLEYQGCDGTDIARYLYGDLKETPCPYLDGATPRFAMQSLGTEWGRDLVGEGNLWVSAWKKYIGNMRMVVVDDVRHANEAEAIHNLNGKVILIVGLSRNADYHPSEFLKKVDEDWMMYNDGTKEDLLAKLKQILS